jgi:hypothetical protein
MWVFKFQKKRKNLDYQRFSRNRENSNKLYELITGMHEVNSLVPKQRSGGRGNGYR